MSRRRYVSTSISHDSALNALAKESDFAALLYTWMVPHAEDDALIHTGSADELMMMVMPGRRDRDVCDVEEALKRMDALGLIVWHEDLIEFSVGSFYKYQTYIKADKRRTEPVNCDCHRPTAKNTEDRRPVAEKAVSPSPSPPPSPSPSVPSERAKPRASKDEDQINRDGIWTALEDLFGKALTRSERSFRGKLTTSLHEAGATYTEIKRRADVWPKLFPVRSGDPPIRLTDSSIEKWWGALGLLVNLEQVRVAPCDVCDSRRIVGISEDGEVVKVDDPRAVANDRCVCVA